MPRVPTVDGPSAEVAPLPGVRQHASSAAGAGLLQQSQQLGQVAQAAQEYARQEQNKRDLDSVFRAETALKDDYLQFEQGELGKRGVDANGIADRTKQWWNDSKKYEAGLTERQLFAFRRSAVALRQSSTQTLMRHERAQGDAALAESAQSRIGVAIDLALADPSPERLANSRQEITEAVSIAGTLAGYPEDVKAAKLGEAMTLMHKGIVMSMVDNDPDAAKAYYYGNKKEIAGGTRVVLEKVLERGGRLQKTQEAADEIMGKFTDLGAAMAHVEKTYQGEDEKDIKAEVHSRFATQQQASNAMSQKAYETGLLAVVQGRHVPADAWSQMDDGHKAAILERQRAEQKRREAEAKGHDVKTDFATYDELNRLSWQNPTAFQALDVRRYADRLSTADLRKFSEDQQKLGTADGVKGLASRQQQIEATIDQLSLTGSKNAEKRGLFKQRVNDAIEDETQRTGRPLKYDEVQRVIDTQTMQMTVHRDLWFDTEKRAFEVTPEEANKAAIKVPAADRALIVEALRAKGQPTTDDNILTLYKRKKGL